MDANEATDTSLRLDPKDYFLFFPLAGTALVVMYDVGFFWSIDVRFFTFFNLSEHAVFALQAIPLALVLLVAMVIETVLLRTIGSGLVITKTNGVIVSECGFKLFAL